MRWQGLAQLFEELERASYELIERRMKIRCLFSGTMKEVISQKHTCLLVRQSRPVAPARVVHLRKSGSPSPSQSFHPRCCLSALLLAASIFEASSSYSPKDSARSWYPSSSPQDSSTDANFGRVLKSPQPQSCMDHRRRPDSPLRGAETPTVKASPCGKVFTRG